MELPQFLHLHSKAPAGLPPCVRPILQHTVVPISTSTKPSANLLAKSCCYPTITPQAPWIPGTRPISGKVLKKEKTQMLKHTERLAGRFYCISQYKDINKKKEGRKQTSLAMRSVCPFQQSCSHLPKCSKRNANHVAKPGTLQIDNYKEPVPIKVYLQHTLTECSLMHTNHCWSQKSDFVLFKWHKLRRQTTVELNKIKALE